MSTTGRHRLVFGVDSLWLLEPPVNGSPVRVLVREDRNLVMPSREKNIVTRYSEAKSNLDSRECKLSY